MKIVNICRRINAENSKLVNSFKTNFKYGFTLAEVLITLGIIGIVAAMTIPNMITNNKAHVLKNQFMKAYSLTQQAYKRLEDDGVGTSPYDYDRTTADRTFKNVFQRYFSGITNCTYNRDNKSCYNLTAGTYKTLDGKYDMDTHYFDDGEFALIDGTLFLFENPMSTNGNNRAWIFIDINGVNGKPNRLGYDLFLFQLTEEGLKAMGNTGTTYTGDENCAIISKNNGLNGMSCTAKAITDPDYFKRITKSIK